MAADVVLAAIAGVALQLMYDPTAFDPAAAFLVLWQLLAE